MTRYPILSTVLAVIPLAALAWPLAQVIKPKPVVPQVDAIIETSPVRRADLSVRSAHPFTSLKVSIADGSWTLTPEEPEKELHFPFPDSGQLPVQVSVIWPEGTPETAVLLEFIPDSLETRTHTLWGQDEVTEELTFTWEPK